MLMHSHRFDDGLDFDRSDHLCQLDASGYHVDHTTQNILTGRGEQILRGGQLADEIPAAVFGVGEDAEVGSGRLVWAECKGILCRVGEEFGCAGV